MNRTEYLAYLAQLPPGTHLSGQHLDESDPQGSYDALVKPLPDVPAILGGSPRVGQNDDLSPNQTLMSILGDHATKGGVVQLEAHFANPFLDASQQSIGSAWLSGPKPDFTALAAPYGVAPSYLAFWAQVDRFVDCIKQLPDNALLVIRLLHEANGEWFWWGHDNTPTKAQQQINLLTRLRTYINSKIKQNPLWMHGGSALSWYAPTDFGRPDWIDLVGCSMYRDNLDWINTEDYASMQATGKPMFFAEAGPSDGEPQPGNWDTTKLLRIPSDIKGWQLWQSYTAPPNGYIHLSAVENLNWQTLYASPSVVTRKDLVTSSPVPPVPPSPSPNPLPSASVTSAPNPFPRPFGFGGIIA